ncbi:MAG: hypothetical protein ABIO94_00515, partial [Opitutaceae bacterium]
VVITNCSASSLANGVKLGTATNAGFKNIVISNIVLDDIAFAGIAVEIVDGGVLDGLNVSQLVMRNVGAALFVRLGDMGRQWIDGVDRPKVGSMRNISISHIIAEEGVRDDGPLASSITGLPGFAVENITLSDIRITTTGAVPKTSGPIDFRAVPENPSGYPEYSMFGPLPARGLYVRHARGLTLRDVYFSSREEDHRSTLIFDDVRDLAIDGLAVRGLPRDVPVVLFNDVRQARILGARIADAADVFLRVEGGSREIALSDNLLNPVTRPVVTASPAEPPVSLP